MSAVKEKEFIRTFVLELILVQKESVFDLWDDESVILPSNYMNVLDEILIDDVKKAKYSSIIPIENIQEWKFNITRELHDFLHSTGVTHNYQKSDIIINLNQMAISKILFNKSISMASRTTITSLAEDFLITKNKVKPKEKKLV